MRAELYNGKMHSTISPVAARPISQPAPRPRRIVLRAREVMASRSVRSAAALRRLLLESGVEISLDQLLRIIDNKCPRVNMEVLNGMLNVLQCSVHELIGEASAHAEPTGDQHA